MQDLNVPALSLGALAAAQLALGAPGAGWRLGTVLACLSMAPQQSA